MIFLITAITLYVCLTEYIIYQQKKSIKRLLEDKYNLKKEMQIMEEDCRELWKKTSKLSFENNLNKARLKLEQANK